MSIDYSVAGPLTDVEGVSAQALASLAAEPVAICEPVHELVIEPAEAMQLGLSAQRLAEKQIRPAGELLARLIQLDPTPLNVSRDPDRRVVGTCRHFAVISCAMLRHRGIPARVRCGFATYFQPGRAVDHWITEYREAQSGRWIRIDSEILGATVLDHPEDLTPEQFLSGGEAWELFRRGGIDAAAFGVYGTDNWGPAEIRGNAVKDLAALNKVEMLPWDEWGRMTAAYDGQTGPDYDDLLDELAAVCAADDPAEVAALFAHADLRVPAELVSSSARGGS